MKSGHKGSRVRAWAALGLSLSLVGCSSLSEHKLGETVSKGSKVKVKLEGKGQIFVSQAVSAKTRCLGLRGALEVSVRGEPGTPPIALTTTCELVKGQYSVITKEMLQPGNYSVQVSNGENGRYLLGKPMVAARLEDPDFNSGADFIVHGAKDLPSGQVAKGLISYPTGNATDWIKISGKGGAVALTFLDGSDNKELTAQVFDMSRGAKAPRLIGVLSHKKTRTFPLKSDNLYVRVKESGYGDGNYSLIRGDSAAAAVSGSGGGGGVKLSVIDCYQVSEGESVVLLEAGEGLKVQDEVVVFGKKTSGELEPLGECEVTAVQAGQASCRMGNQVGTQYTEFRAIAKGKG